MRAVLTPLFGEVPPNAENLEIIGPCKREQTWTTIWPDSGVVRWADGSIEMETLWIEKNLEQCSDYHSRWSWFPVWHRGRYFNLSLFWWSLAKTLGHNYTCAVGRAVNNPEGEANLEVSVEQFESALEQLTATATAIPKAAR
jgi:hypothetical protein